MNAAPIRLSSAVPIDPAQVKHGASRVKIYSHNASATPTAKRKWFAAVLWRAFPSSWYVTCSALAVLSGIECPPQLFGMRRPNATPIVDGLEDIQEPASLGLHLAPKSGKASA